MIEKPWNFLKNKHFFYKVLLNGISSLVIMKNEWVLQFCSFGVSCLLGCNPDDNDKQKEYNTTRDNKNDNYKLI